MKRANIADLKNRLSYFLRFVRRGESVVVYDRERAVARIEPMGAASGRPADAWTTALEESGVLRAPSAPLRRGWLQARPAPKADVLGALLVDRESGR